MKQTNPAQHHAHRTILQCHKSGKGSEKCSKLDRKSSRGMIYENEELRLRTININAEVERGQSDIKRLKKENELLRREIWTLRDECDRLSKKVKAKFNERSCCNNSGGGGVQYVHQKGHRCHCNDNGGNIGRRDKSDVCTEGGCDGIHRTHSSDDSDSCTSDCCCPDVDENADKVEEHTCQDNCCKDNSNILTDIKECIPQTCIDGQSGNKQEHKIGGLLKTFDHLSVVSEETLSNTDALNAHQQTGQLLGFTPDICGSQATLPSLVGPLTPLTPIDLIANELNDLQSAGPPLSYFENILQQHMNSKTENSSDAFNDIKNLPEHTNSWDYNLQSPFSRKLSVKTMPQKANHQTLTSFVPAGIVPLMASDPCVNSRKSACNDTSTYETVSIRTGPVPLPVNESIKHFFAPLKPQLRINTALANQKKPILASAAYPPLPTHPPSYGSECNDLKQNTKLEPPDIYVTNALASPCHGTKLSAQTLATIHRPSLDVAKAKVSPRLLRRKHMYRNTQRRGHPQQTQQGEQQQHAQYNHPHNPLRRKLFVTNKTNFDINRIQPHHILYTTLCLKPKKALAATSSSLTAALVSCNTLNLQLLPLHMQSTLPTITTTNPGFDSSGSIKNITNTTTNEYIALHANRTAATCFNLINSNNFTKPNDPVYAIAQKSCYDLITASAVPKPLMATTSNSLNLLTTPSIVPVVTPSLLVAASCCLTLNTLHTIKFAKSSNSFVVDAKTDQNDSVDLEAILNDIEAISEDIWSLQLEKKSRENLCKNTNESMSIASHFKNSTKNKPYKSEMNLLLTYEDDVPTIKRAPGSILNVLKSDAEVMIAENCALRRTRSWEGREQHQVDNSPPPNVPDAMPPFPDKPTYLNMAATAKQTSPITMESSNVLQTLLQRETTRFQTSPSVSNSKVKGTVRSISVQNANTASAGSDECSLANATIRRSLFRSAPTQRLDSNENPTEVDANLDSTDSIEEIVNTTADNTTDAFKHMPRKVSIICDTADKSPPEYTMAVAVNDIPSSCCNLPPVLSNPTVRHLKQLSHSTPNTPHSSRKHEEPPLSRMVTTPAISITNTNQLASMVDGEESAQQQKQHQHQHSPHSNGAQITRKGNKQDTMRAAASDMICVAANVVRTKCVRRHSDGTIIHAAHQRASSNGNGTTNNTISASHPHSHNHTHHHQLHHNHHQGSAGGGPMSACLTHSHQRQDSNQETNASHSDRNSNSSTSSRESSAGFSQSSQRRKLSVSSHTGGKIPWCGCWGNGCL